VTAAATPGPVGAHDDRSATADEDVAVVLALLAAAGGAVPESAPGPRSVWSDPAHRLGLRSTGSTGWWASGLPR
jgi:hypothetical protein